VIVEIAELATPIGTIVLAVREARLCALGFDRPYVERSLRSRFPADEIGATGEADRFVTMLGAYFDGDLAALDTVAIDLRGTAFQKRVWSALRKIPCGRTASYGDVAAAIGSPSAVRAVGAANGANPIAIVVPCHRVVGAYGNLTGYGGGIERKRWLLAHENATSSLPFAFAESRPAADAPGTRRRNSRRSPKG
jgi:methylated-DNA-[protein]-cysteine S-methyltransferase